MDNINILPYEALNYNQWTVEGLIVSIAMQDENRIPLTELCDINPNSISNLKDTENKLYPYIEIKNIDVDRKSISDFNIIKKDDFPSRARLVAYPGDVLLSIIRPEKGAIAILSDEYDEYVVSNTVAVLRPQRLSSSSELLYFILSCDKVLYELGLLATGVSVPSLTLKKLREYRLLKSVNREKEFIAKKLYND